MSALRAMLAALWAAVWVRWRLLAVRARRVWGGGGSVGAADAGYYLSPAEIPVEGVDYELADLPAELAARLEATREELVGHARGVTAGRGRRRRIRRRRTASIATASLLSLAVLGAGASALVGGTTGVPAVDRLLGIYETNLEKPGTEGRGGPGGRDLQPQAAGESTTLRVPLGDGRSVVSTSYVANDGKICTATTQEPDPGPLRAITCLEPAQIDRHIEENGLIHGVSLPPGKIVIRGLVDAHIASLTGRGPSGPMKIDLGVPWTPDVAGIGSARAFLAVADQPRDQPQLESHAVRFEVELNGTTDDGDRVSLLP